MDTVVFVVEFTYTVESSTDPQALLPGLEDALQEIVAANLLSGCLQPDDVRGLRKVNHNVKKRRQLNQRRRLAATAVSSAPIDVISRDCLAVINGSNQCAFIKGSMSVRIGAQDTMHEIKSLVQSTAENAMTTNQLLSEDVPGLKKVTYVKPEPIESPVIKSTGMATKSTSPIAVIAIGSSFAALAVVLGAFLLRKRQKKETEDEDDDNLCSTTVLSGVDSKHPPVDSESCQAMLLVQQDGKTKLNNDRLSVI